LVAVGRDLEPEWNLDRRGIRSAARDDDGIPQAVDARGGHRRLRRRERGGQHDDRRRGEETSEASEAVAHDGILQKCQSKGHSTAIVIHPTCRFECSSKTSAQPMRLISIAFSWIAACVLVMAQAPPAQPVKPTGTAAAAAEATLAATRAALGGEKKLAAVKTIVATGRTRQVRGENLVPIEFEIAMELPDKYVRKDEIPAQESDPTTAGFNGAELILLPVPSATGRGGQPTPPAALEAAR